MFTTISASDFEITHRAITISSILSVANICPGYRDAVRKKDLLCFFCVKTQPKNKNKTIYWRQ